MTYLGAGSRQYLVRGSPVVLLVGLLLAGLPPVAAQVETLSVDVDLIGSDTTTYDDYVTVPFWVSVDMDGFACAGDWPELIVHLTTDSPRASLPEDEMTFDVPMRWGLLTYRARQAGFMTVSASDARSPNERTREIVTLNATLNEVQGCAASTTVNEVAYLPLAVEFRPPPTQTSYISQSDSSRGLYISPFLLLVLLVVLVIVWANRRRTT